MILYDFMQKTICMKSRYCCFFVVESHLNIHGNGHKKNAAR